jgi:hypothetical protein
MSDKGFFAVDRRTWAVVCTMGLNEAVSYLVMARGTGPDNATTSWSARAVEKYTGMTRYFAKPAIGNLAERGIISVEGDHAKPRYRLLPAREIPGSGAFARPELDYFEQQAYEYAAQGNYIAKKNRHHFFARQAVEKGWLEDWNGSFRAVPAPNTDPELVWLPTSLVTGATSEKPPVDLIRETRDVMALRLFVDCYFHQHLLGQGGISREVVFGNHKRHRVGESGQYVIWGFTKSRSQTSGNWSDLLNPHRRELTDEEEEKGYNEGIDFWRRFDLLVKLGLLSWCPMLFEGDDAQAGVMHALGTGTGDSIEDRIGQAADAAGRSMITQGQQDWAEGRGLVLVPVAAHIEPSLTSVARLLYRPRTALTTTWDDERQKKGEKWIETYAKRIAASTSQSARFAS